MISINKNLDEKKFLIQLEPVPYKALESDPQADLPLSQQESLSQALLAAKKSQPLHVKGILGRKGYRKLAEIIIDNQV